MGLSPRTIKIFKIIGDAETPVWSYKIAAMMKIRNNSIVYREVQRLVDLGWVVRDRRPAPRGAPRMVCLITDDGRKALETLLSKEKFP